MSTLDDRARLIYEFLRTNLGQGLTMVELCGKLGLQPGRRTATAIRRARDLATDDGLHFPPAVPQNDFTYRVTTLPGDAIDPTLQMGRIAAGVHRREGVGIEFLRRHRRELPQGDRVLADAFLGMHDSYARAQAETRRHFDDMIVSLVKIRREEHAQP